MFLQNALNVLLVSATIVAALPSSRPPLHLPLQIIKSQQGKQLTKRAGEQAFELTRSTTASQFGIVVGVGTPQQSVLLLLDTSSPDTYVVSSTCVSTGACLEGFDYIQSATYSRVYKNGEQSFKITNNSSRIGDGAEGTYFTDNISLAYVISDYPFGLIEKSPASKSGLNADNNSENDFSSGVLGFGPSSLSSVYARMYKEGKIPKPVFSISRGHSSHDRGVLVLGGIDENANINNVVYTNIADPNKWRVTVPGVQLFKGDSFTDIKLNEGGGGIDFDIDTGATQTTASRTMITSLLKAIGISTLEFDDIAKAYYKFDCGNQESISGSIIIYLTSPIDSNSGKPGSYLSVPLSELIDKTGNTCLIKILPLDKQQGEAFTFGIDFFNDYVKIFEFEPSASYRIGFAPFKDA
jgi:hypothetical protein